MASTTWFGLLALVIAGGEFALGVRMVFKGSPKWDRMERWYKKHEKWMVGSGHRREIEGVTGVLLVFISFFHGAIALAILGSG